MNPGVSDVETEELLRKMKLRKAVESNEELEKYYPTMKPLLS